MGGHEQERKGMVPLVTDTIEDKIQSMGLALPPPHKSEVANIERSVRSGNLLFISGHGPRTAAGLKYRGKVGRELTVDQGYDAARLCALGCLRTAKDALGSLDRIRRVVKILGFVNSAEGLNEQPRVMNGASDLLVQLFGERGRHGRSAIGVYELPNGMPVEVEMILEVE